MTTRNRSSVIPAVHPVSMVIAPIASRAIIAWARGGGRFAERERGANRLGWGTHR